MRRACSSSGWSTSSYVGVLVGREVRWVESRYDMNSSVRERVVAIALSTLRSILSNEHCKRRVACCLAREILPNRQQLRNVRQPTDGAKRAMMT